MTAKFAVQTISKPLQLLEFQFPSIVEDFEVEIVAA